MNEMNFAQARHNMVEQQIRTWTVLDKTVLDTIEHFIREDFVPQAYKRMAYTDTAIPLGHGQEMMHPKIEAHLLQALDIQPTDNVLEIGTGSGSVTALLAKLGATVDSVDIFPDFQKTASSKLATKGYTNVRMIEGDGSKGWGKELQYDAIAITGALPELPEQYKNALKVGGRLFCIIGKGNTMQAMSICRTHGNQWTEKSLFETHLPYLVNAEKPAEFEF